MALVWAGFGGGSGVAVKTRLKALAVSLVRLAVFQVKALSKSRCVFVALDSLVAIVFEASGISNRAWLEVDAAFRTVHPSVANFVLCDANLRVTRLGCGCCGWRIRSCGGIIIIIIAKARYQLFAAEVIRFARFILEADTGRGGRVAGQSLVALVSCGWTGLEVKASVTIDSLESSVDSNWTHLGLARFFGLDGIGIDVGVKVVVATSASGISCIIVV